MPSIKEPTGMAHPIGAALFDGADKTLSDDLRHSTTCPLWEANLMVLVCSVVARSRVRAKLDGADERRTAEMSCCAPRTRCAPHRSNADVDRVLGRRAFGGRNSSASASGVGRDTSLGRCPLAAQRRRLARARPPGDPNASHLVPDAGNVAGRRGRHGCWTTPQPNHYVL
jgi:hypothetical protein